MLEDIRIPGRYLLGCIGTRFKGMLLTMTWDLILLSLVCETMKKGKEKVGHSYVRNSFLNIVTNNF